MENTPTPEIKVYKVLEAFELPGAAEGEAPVAYEVGKLYEFTIEVATELGVKVELQVETPPAAPAAPAADATPAPAVKAKEWAGNHDVMSPESSGK